MLKRILAPTVAAAIAAGGAYSYATPPEPETRVVVWRMKLLKSGSIACEGVCRSTPAGATNSLLCQLHPPEQATLAACEATLASECTAARVLKCGAP